MILSLRDKMSQNIKGQDELIESLLIAILTDGHLLLEGLPGLGKTVSIKTLAKLTDLNFNRIQFTPDLLPSDLLGTMIYNPETRVFEPRKGPLFTNLVLADEINRAPAKVQSALLEVMAEGQISLGTETYHLDKPFLVLATQNPIEQDGTFMLPEAQLDRFLMKVDISYPSRDAEIEILNSVVSFEKMISAVTPEYLIQAGKSTSEIYLSPMITEYVADIVRATRNPESYGIALKNEFIAFGASPRGGQALLKAAKALTFINEGDTVTPYEIKKVAHRVLRHRIGLSFEGRANYLSTNEVVSKILKTLPLP